MPTDIDTSFLPRRIGREKGEEDGGGGGGGGVKGGWEEKRTG